MTDTSTKTLSDSQVEAWERDGFLVLDDFVAAGSLDALRAAYDEILSKHVEASGDRMLGGIIGEEPRAVPVQHRGGGDHLRIDARPPREQAMEEPAMPVGPFHHGSDTEPM